jgi:AcrR family transcriptional regulator
MSKSSELSRIAIVDRALEIADVDGVDAVTFRRLAQEFGVTPMALYWHVSNKDELLAAMGDRFFDDLRIPEQDNWLEQLRVSVTALVDSLRRHPGGAHLAPARVLVCPPGRDLAERTLGDLRAVGFSISEATDIARTAMQTAAMLVCEEAGAEVGVPAARRAEVTEAKRQSIAALSIEQYPNLVDCAESITQTADESSYYRFGVDLFISGVDALHQAKLAHTS